MLASITLKGDMISTALLCYHLFNFPCTIDPVSKFWFLASINNIAMHIFIKMSVTVRPKTNSDLSTEEEIKHCCTFTQWSSTQQHKETNYQPQTTGGPQTMVLSERRKESALSDPTHGALEGSRQIWQQRSEQRLPLADATGGVYGHRHQAVR